MTAMADPAEIRPPRARAAKMRLDVILVERALVPSRERARALILAGRVLVSEQKVDKPGTAVSPDSPIRLLGEDILTSAAAD